VITDTNSPGLAALGNIYLRIGDSGSGFSQEPEWAVLLGESDRLTCIQAYLA